MENNCNYYSTFKFYDGQGRRLAIFGEEKEEGKMLVTVITCSKKDQFSKKESKEAYEKGYITKYKKISEGLDEKKRPKIKIKTDTLEVHPVEFIIPIGDNKPKFSLIKFCKENYLQRRLGLAFVEYEYFIKQKPKDDNKS